MALLGFLLLITGVVMNVQVLRRGRSAGMTGAQLMRLTPWQVSVGLTLAGIVLVFVGGR